MSRRVVIAGGNALKHLKAFLLVVLSVVVLSAPARAHAVQFKTAGEIADDCRSNASICYGFLEGVNDTIQAIELQFGNSSPVASICMPNNVRAGELAAVFVKYVQDKPTTQHLSAASVAVNAFQESYPCGGAK